MLAYNLYEICFMVAVVGYVYTTHLISEGNILNGWHRWLMSKLETQHALLVPDNAPDEVKAMPGYKPNIKKRIFTKKHWLQKPLGACMACFTGQLALWVTAFAVALPYLPWSLAMAFLIIGRLAFAICFAILIATTIKTILDLWQKHP